MHDVLRRFADTFAGSSLALDTGGPVMMTKQERNPVFRAVTARMKWTCGDPRSLEALGLTLRESRTFAQPQPQAARTWSAKYRWGIKLFGWAPPVSTYKLNLFDIPG